MAVLDLERVSKSLRRPVPIAMPDHVEIAVLIPCYNEALAIGPVVSGFRAALPQARVYVYDNNSQDATVAVGRAAGAIVRHERLQGKGHVVARMFADVDAEVYVLVDGDATYDPDAAPRLVQHLLDHRLDLVNGRRDGVHGRRGHRLGSVRNQSRDPRMNLGQWCSSIRRGNRDG
jgi:glycosyltransferase involved in cell wall biosynthesis